MAYKKKKLLEASITADRTVKNGLMKRCACARQMKYVSFLPGAVQKLLFDDSFVCTYVQMIVFHIV